MIFDENLWFFKNFFRLKWSKNNSLYIHHFKINVWNQIQKFSNPTKFNLDISLQIVTIMIRYHPFIWSLLKPSKSWIVFGPRFSGPINIRILIIHKVPEPQWNVHWPFGRFHLCNWNVTKGKLHMYNLSYLPELEINYGALNVCSGQIFLKFDYFLSKMARFG